MCQEKSFTGSCDASRQLLCYEPQQLNEAQAEIRTAVAALLDAVQRRGPELGLAGTVETAQFAVLAYAEELGYEVEYLRGPGVVVPYRNARPLTRREQADRATRAAFRRIGERDGFVCRQCGIGKTLTVDHIIAVVNGGSDEDDNFQLLCKKHNSAKGAS